jgi:hypothetical protein
MGVTGVSQPRRTSRTLTLPSPAASHRLAAPAQGVPYQDLNHQTLKNVTLGLVRPLAYQSRPPMAIAPTRSHALQMQAWRLLLVGVALAAHGSHALSARPSVTLRPRQLLIGRYSAHAALQIAPPLQNARAVAQLLRMDGFATTASEPFPRLVQRHSRGRLARWFARTLRLVTLSFVLLRLFTLTPAHAAAPPACADDLVRGAAALPARSSHATALGAPGAIFALARASRLRYVRRWPQRSRAALPPSPSPPRPPSCRAVSASASAPACAFATAPPSTSAAPLLLPLVPPSIRVRVARPPGPRAGAAGAAG